MTDYQKRIAARACALMEADFDLPLRAAVAIAAAEDEWPDVMGYVLETTRHLEPR